MTTCFARHNPLLHAANTPYMSVAFRYLDLVKASYLLKIGIPFYDEPKFDAYEIGIVFNVLGQGTKRLVYSAPEHQFVSTVRRLIQTKDKMINKGFRDEYNKHNWFDRYIRSGNPKSHR